jgi:nucleotide-binding universal stress UspA family protein
MPGILFATHGAASADGAGRVAALLSERRGVTIDTTTVLEPLPILDGGFAPAYIPTPEEIEAVRSSLRALVSEQMRRCGVTGSMHVRTGLRIVEIARAAREMQAELIVVGIGRHGIAERALGNETALQLVQFATVPVLAVPTETSKLPSRVLVAMDFSRPSIASAKAVARWLGRNDVLHLVYVAGEWHGGYPIEQRASAESMLAAVVREIDVHDDVVCEQSVVEGDPATRLLEIATTSAAECVAMGSHGYGFWKRLTLGSVASKTLRMSRISVYVTPIGCIAGQQDPAVATGSVEASS